MQFLSRKSVSTSYPEGIRVIPRPIPKSQETNSLFQYPGQKKPLSHAPWLPSNRCRLLPIPPKTPSALAGNAAPPTWSRHPRLPRLPALAKHPVPPVPGARQEQAAGCGGWEEWNVTNHNLRGGFSCKISSSKA